MEMKRNPITPDALTAFAAASYIPFKSGASKADVVRSIAEKISAELGKQLHPALLSRPDDVSVKFIELLDQIVFEMESAHNGNGNKTEDYIIDDLYGRAEVFLEYYNDVEKYKKGLASRILTLDDTVIIGHNRMNEYIPVLMSEFNDQPHLRFAILQSLSLFDDESLINFFYEIANNGHEIELKIVALLGLKNNRNRFYNWHRLNGQEDLKYKSLISYVTENGNSGRIHVSNPYVLFYRLLILDHTLKGEMNEAHCRDLLDILNDVADADLESTALKNVMEEVFSSILSKVNSEAMQQFLECGDNLAAFLNSLEFLPPEIFEKAVVMIGSMNDHLILEIEKLSAKGLISISDRNLKFSAYLFPHEPGNIEF